MAIRFRNDVDQTNNEYGHCINGVKLNGQSTFYGRHIVWRRCDWFHPL